jgi:hypothetical protein
VESGNAAGTTQEPESSRDFAEGFLLGVLVGEGHFGGDGKQPQVTLRMHARHGSLFQWILTNFPGGKLYGPYQHSGRHYFQWMARGAFLRETLWPLLERRLHPGMDAKTFEAVQQMRARYADALGAAPKRDPVAPAARFDSTHGQSDSRANA